MESLTDSPKTIDCREVMGLITATMDYAYQFGLGEYLELSNPLPADIYFEQTVESLFDGRKLVFIDKEDGRRLDLTHSKVLHSAFEYARMFPEEYAEIGASIGYPPHIGMKILLAALYGWPEVVASVGDRFKRYLKAA